MLEKEIEAYLVERVKTLGGRAYKWTSPSHRGVPDRLVVLPGGRVMAVECKRPGGRTTRLQDREIARLNELGLETHVVASKDDIDRLLQTATRQ
ncbi:MAG: VRR-NUC domain-containing protein [Gammaproteobacteria bacterium SHHR-1]